MNFYNLSKINLGGQNGDKPCCQQYGNAIFGDAGCAV
jgi:hypothetical protein